MQIRHMRMAVRQRCMPMTVAVRAARGITKLMLMLMVLVMIVGVLMFFGNMLVLVVVSFTQVQPKPECHQRALDNQGPRERIAEYQCHGRTDERRYCEIRPRP